MLRHDSRYGLDVNSGVRTRSLSKHTSPKSESVSSRVTLAYEHGSAFGRVNLLVSFSAWAQLIWRYLLEVTKTVNPSSIPGSTLKKLFESLTLTPTLILTLTLTLSHKHRQPEFDPRIDAQKLF